MNEEKQSTVDSIVIYILFIAFFAFTVMGVLALGSDPDFVFDKFFGAGICLFFSLFYRKLGMKWYSIVALGIVLLSHNLKLYGNVYYGIQFDMIMHFVAGFCIAIIVFQFLTNCEGIGCSSIIKIIFLSVFVTAGLGTVLEITEYFGYVNLPPGEGILHFGTGDAGEWTDSTWDMICNLVGAVIASILMALIYRRKKNLHNLKMFIISSRR